MPRFEFGGCCYLDGRSGLILRGTARASNGGNSWFFACRHFVRFGQPRLRTGRSGIGLEVYDRLGRLSDGNKRETFEDEDLAKGEDRVGRNG